MAPLTSITLKQLRALRAVDTAGSLAGAAELVHLTPPAVHAQLRALEQNTGCRLVTRGSGTRSHLTPEGKRLCTVQGTIEGVLGRALADIESLKSGKQGRVSLGVVSTGKYFAPGLVARINAAHPGIDLALRIGNRGEIIAMLRDGAVDIVIMGRPPREPVVSATPIGDHPHVLIAGAGHPLVANRDVDPDDLFRETFIVREPGSGTRILMTRYLDRIGEGAPYRTVEMGSNETIKQAVIAGLGIALISRHTVMEELRTGRLATIDLGDLPIVRQWFLLHEARTVPTGAGAVVYQFILDQKGDFLP